MCRKYLRSHWSLWEIYLATKAQMHITHLLWCLSHMLKQDTSDKPLGDPKGRRCQILSSVLCFNLPERLFTCFKHMQCWRISADYCVSVKYCIFRQPEGCAWGVGGRFVGSAPLWAPAGHKRHMAGIHQTSPALQDTVGPTHTHTRLITTLFTHWFTVEDQALLLTKKWTNWPTTLSILIKILKIFHI